MAESAIANKIRASRGFVQKRIAGYRRWALICRFTHLLCMVAAIGIAAALGAGGKSVAQPLGEAINSDLRNAQEITALGWRTGCWSVAALGVLAWFAARFLVEITAPLTRAQTLNAAFASLLLDVEHNNVTERLAIRDYQRLLDSYPEFVK